MFKVLKKDRFMLGAGASSLNFSGLCLGNSLILTASLQFVFVCIGILGSFSRLSIISIGVLGCSGCLSTNRNNCLVQLLLSFVMGSL